MRRQRSAGGAGGQSLKALLEVAFQYDYGRGRIDAAFIQRPVAAVFKQARAGLNRTQSFIVEKDRDAKEAMSVIGEITRAPSAVARCRPY